MNKFKLILLGIFIISLSSCSDDGDSVSLSDEEKMLVGAWNFTSFEYTGTSTGFYEGMEISSTYQGIGQDMDAVLTFKDNKTFNFQGSYDVLLSVSGYEEMLIPVENASSSGDWYIKDDYLFTSDAIGQVDNQMIQSPENSRMRIQESTANRLVLIIDQESELNENGVEYLVKLSGQYILTK